MNTDQLIYLVLGGAGLGVFAAWIVCWLIRRLPWPFGGRSAGTGPTTPLVETDATSAQPDPEPVLGQGEVAVAEVTRPARKARHWVM